MKRSVQVDARDLVAVVARHLTACEVVSRAGSNPTVLGNDGTGIDTSISSVSGSRETATSVAPRSRDHDATLAQDEGLEVANWQPFNIECRRIDIWSMSIRGGHPSGQVAE